MIYGFSLWPPRSAIRSVTAIVTCRVASRSPRLDRLQEPVAIGVEHHGENDDRPDDDRFHVVAGAEQLKSGGQHLENAGADQRADDRALAELPPKEPIREPPRFRLMYYIGWTFAAPDPGEATVQI